MILKSKSLIRDTMSPKQKITKKQKNIILKYVTDTDINEESKLKTQNKNSQKQNLRKETANDEILPENSVSTSLDQNQKTLLVSTESQVSGDETLKGSSDNFNHKSKFYNLN